MRKVVFYISGLGFGHLTRSMAVIRELIKRSGIHVTVKCHPAHMPMVVAEFQDRPQSVTVLPFEAGFTIYFDEKTSKVDLAGTLDSVNSWLDSLMVGAAAETTTCRSAGYELVLSDIAPEAFFVAEALQVPSIGISNYTWYEFLREFTGEQRVNGLKAMYGKASAFFEYPLSTGDLMPVKVRLPVGLVSRPLDQDKIDCLRKTFWRPGRLLLFLSVGGALSLRNVSLSPDIDYLYTRGIDLPAAPNAIQIPADTADTQNYLAACDGVITKCGWSTVAEGLIAKKPLYLMRTGAGGLEESCMLRELAELGVSQIIEYKNELSLDKELFTNNACLLSGYDKISAKYTNQVGMIADKVLNYLENC